MLLFEIKGIIDKLCALRVIEWSGILTSCKILKLCCKYVLINTVSNVNL